MVGDAKRLAAMFEKKANDLVGSNKFVVDGLAKTKATRSRLETAALKAAKCDQSRNPTVRGLWDAIEDYNSSWTHPSKQSTDQVIHSTACLDCIYSLAASYMTDKVFKEHNATGGEARRKQRYTAYQTLLESVAKELESYGGKTLVGPSDFRTTKRNYWLERLDPLNRAGYLITGEYKKWQTASSPLSFWDWLQANGGAAIAVNTRVAGYATPGVAQWQHSKHFAAGGLTSADDTPFSTALLRTEFSQQGWAVWVASMLMFNEAFDDSGHFIFSNTHRAGWDHHSSFLGGNAVLAAGEWIVENGTIKVITGKSGHYMPKCENLRTFVSRFQQIPSNAIIRPDMLDHANGTSTIKFYRVGDFRTRGLGATPLNRATVLGAIGAANSNITEHWAGGSGLMSALLPP